MKPCGDVFPGFPETCELEQGHADTWHRAGMEEDSEGSRSYRVRWNDEERRELQEVEIFTKHPGYNIKITL